MRDRLVACWAALSFSFVLGCIPIYRIANLPAARVGGIEVSRPAEGEPKRYDLAAWGERSLLEFSDWSPFWGNRTLRIYPDATVCSFAPYGRDSTLLRFRTGSAVPTSPSEGKIPIKDAVSLEVASALAETKDSVPNRLILVVVGSAARQETTSPRAALELSEKRARAVADLILQVRPELDRSKIELLPLGWDGNAASDKNQPAEWIRRAVTIRNGVPTEGQLPLLFFGPPVAAQKIDALGKALAEAGALADVGGPYHVEDAGSISFAIGELKGHIDGGALLPKFESRRGTDGKTVINFDNAADSEVASLLKPFFDAFEFGCQFKGSQ